MVFPPFWFTTFFLDQRNLFEHFCIDLESVGKFSFFHQNPLTPPEKESIKKIFLS